VTFAATDWCRPLAEVDFLMCLAEEYAVRELSELQRNGVRLQLMGRRDGLPGTLLKEKSFLSLPEAFSYPNLHLDYQSTQDLELSE
jgi:undecaprenyl diphosphate synthase